MKKNIFTFVLGLFISVTAFAQKTNEEKANKAVESSIASIEKTIKLTDSEKESYSKLSKDFFMKHFELKSLKTSDPDTYKKEVKANKTNFSKNLSKEVGKERADEILKAAKANKGKKGKKSKK